MFCSNCGIKVDEDAKFCHACGIQVSGEDFVGVAIESSNVIEANAVEVDTQQVQATDRRTVAPFDPTARPYPNINYYQPQSVPKRRGKGFVIAIAVLIPLVLATWLIGTVFSRPEEVESAYSMQDGVAKVAIWPNALDKSGKELPEMYLVSKSGKRISKSYNFIAPFYEGMALAANIEAGDESDKYSAELFYLDKKGKEKYVSNIDEFYSWNPIGAIKQYGGNYDEGITRVTREGKSGFIDKKGKEVIPFVYDAAGDFLDGLSVFIRDGLYGLLDKNGKEIAPNIYENIMRAEDNSDWIAVNRDGLWGFLDKSGKEVISCQYDLIREFDLSFSRVKKFFSDGLHPVCRDSEWGFIDEKGKEVIPCQYEDVSMFKEGLAAVRRDGKWGFIDKKGKEVISCQYNEVVDFSDGLAAVRLGSDWRFVDKNNEIKIEGFKGVESYEDYMFKYSWEYSYRLNDSFLAFNKNNGWNKIIEIQVLVFKDGVAIVPKDNKQGNTKLQLINKKGETISKDYDLFFPFKGDYAIVARKTKSGEYLWGYVNKKGDEVVSCQYYFAYPFSEGVAAVAEKRGDDIMIKYINAKGDTVIRAR